LDQNIQPSPAGTLINFLLFPLLKQRAIFIRPPDSTTLAAIKNHLLSRIVQRRFSKNRILPKLPWIKKFSRPLQGL
jgi:hypothetical protein